MNFLSRYYVVACSNAITWVHPALKASGRRPKGLITYLYSIHFSFSFVENLTCRAPRLRLGNSFANCLRISSRFIRQLSLGSTSSASSLGVNLVFFAVCLRFISCFLPLPTCIRLRTYLPCPVHESHVTGAGKPFCLTRLYAQESRSRVATLRTWPENPPRPCPCPCPCLGSHRRQSTQGCV